tara:strand:- start:2269 stop:2799 length:531 start_codon:yes stop_codon:yes gene_type:complete
MDSPAYECYVEKVRKTFRAQGLNGEDIYRIANCLNKLEKCYGSLQCWDIEASRHLERGFTSSNQYCARYKGKNANPLILAVYNIFSNPEKDENVLVRKGSCHNHHCINPRHFFYGDKIDLKIEKWQRSGIDIDKYKFGQVLWKYKQNKDNICYREIATEFNLSYNTVRSICNHENN